MMPAANKRLRDELHGEHRDRWDAESGHLHRDAQRNADHGKAAVDVALDPVIGRTAAVIAQNIRVARCCGVEFIALQHDVRQAEYDGAVRVPGAVRERVVPAMNGDPLARHRGCAEPQPEAKEVPHRRVQREGAMGLIAMQV
jgi:hypothetical protein